MNADPVRPHVLICDGDRHSVAALRTVLRDAGMAVSPTHTGQEALGHAEVRVSDAAIIEMELVDCTGSEVCRALREWTAIPILVLSHISREDAVVTALEAGADDYITKPFRPRELIARLRANLGRAAGPQQEPVVSCGDLRIDLSTRTIGCHERHIRLTPTEHRLLRALIRNRGRLLTHETLLRQVWGAGYVEDRHVLRAHMANLRRKLATPGADGPIRTYPGAGYLFEAPVTVPLSPRSPAGRPEPVAAPAAREPSGMGLLIPLRERHRRGMTAGS